MSISNVLVQQVYTTNGLTTSFPIPFAFLPDSAEEVTKVYKVDTDTGEKTLQAIGALNDYTLPHDVDTQPANVVFNTAPDDCDILVTRYLPIQQAIEFLNSGQMLLDNIEEGMDILTMLIQQVNEMASKSVRLHEIETLNQFNPVLPPGMHLVPGGVPIINPDGDGWELPDAWPTGDDIEEAEENAEAAAASANAAANSAASAAGSAADADQDAQDIAEILGQFTGGPFDVTEGTSSDLTDELYDSALYNQVDITARIIRGTEVFHRQEFSLFFRDSAWELVNGFDRFSDAAEADHGVTFTVNPSSGQINAAVASDGEGNAEITFKKVVWDL